MDETETALDCCNAARERNGHTFECDRDAYAAGTRSLADCKGTLWEKPEWRKGEGTRIRDVDAS